jgi:predicted nucleotidyltransferase
MDKLPPREKEAIRNFLIDKENKRQSRLDERYQTAIKDTANIIRMILEHFEPVRIYQWGSLLDRKKFQEISDIDIAVEGLSSTEELFRLYGEAEKMTDLPLDIVELERIHPAHAASIRSHGRLAYERSE